MKLPKTVKLKTFVVTTAIMLVILFATVSYVLSQSSGTFTISQGIYPGAPTYTIWRESITYFAKTAYGFIDYYGTNATTVVRNCIKDNTTIRFAEGLYVISVIYLDKDYLTFEGSGYGTILKLADGANTNILKVTKAHINSLTIQNMQLDGNKYNQQDQPWRDDLSGIYFNGNNTELGGEDGVVNASHTTIRNLWVHDVRSGAAVRLKGLTYGSRVENLFLYNNGLPDVQCDGMWIGNSSRFTVTNCLFMNNTDTGFASDKNEEFMVSNCESVWDVERGFSYCWGSSHGTYVNIIGRESKIGFEGMVAASYVPGTVSPNWLMLSGSFTDNSVYGLRLSNCTNVRLGEVYCTSNTVNSIYEDGTTFFKRNGFATITDSTSITFNHDLAGTPSHVECGFKTAGYGSWIWSASSTQITITVTNSGTYNFTWYAEYSP